MKFTAGDSGRLTETDNYPRKGWRPGANRSRARRRAIGGEATMRAREWDTEGYVERDG